MSAPVTRIASALAECNACRWRSAAPSASALAGRHHTETGHPVRVSVEIVTQYGDAVGRPEGQESLLEQLEERRAA